MVQPAAAVAVTGSGCGGGGGSSGIPGGQIFDGLTGLYSDWKSGGARACVRHENRRAAFLSTPPFTDWVCQDVPLNDFPFDYTHHS
jgi:hypothetical protein